MSHATEPTSKKRKQSSTINDVEISTKKLKKDSKEKKDKNSQKGKARDTEFHVVKASLVLSIPPVFASNPRIGAEEMLDSMVMRYIPALRGVVLSHSNISFHDRKASIQGDCPFLVCRVGFDATIWSPRVGMKLVGKVNLCSPDHISLLLHRTFNVSIPRHHIPTDQLEFEYGPAENDPEFGPEAADRPQAEGADEGTSGKREEHGGGKWIHKLTGQKLAGAENFLEFTVVGLTVANEMLSVVGSIQDDPFSPEHVLKPVPLTKAESQLEDIEGNDLGSRHDSDDEIESSPDTFQEIGRKVNEEAAAKRKAEELEQLVAKDKKKKRKTEKGTTKEKEKRRSDKQHKF